MSSSEEAPSCSGKAVVCVPYEEDSAWLLTRCSAPSSERRDTWLEMFSCPGDRDTCWAGCFCPIPHHTAVCALGCSALAGVKGKAKGLGPPAQESCRAVGGGP